MLLTGAEIIIECLLEQGVDTVFGYPGGTALCVYDALYKYADKLRHILMAHEQGAAHAADGYARSTGKTGVCLVTSGPGATNLVTGIATAYMDSSPMVAITVNVSTGSLGKDSFQEVDIAGVTMPVTKHGFIVKNIEELASTLRRAFSIASRGRRGPVLVDITKDVTQCRYEYTPEVTRSSPNEPPCASDGELVKLVRMMRKACAPVLLVGGGAAASGAAEEIKEFTENYRIAVVDTLMGRGTYSCDNDNYYGMAGIHGTKAANFALSNADLIISLGCRFSDRVTASPSSFARKAKIVQIDIDAAELNKNVIPELAILSDIKVLLKKLNIKLKKSSLSGGSAADEKGRNPWMRELDEIRRQSSYCSSESNNLSGPDIIRIISECAPQAIVTTEVGQHQMWAATFYKFTTPHSLITSGGLGTMGFGLGAAIGAQLGNPEKTVINIAGDGCLRMNMNELSTISAYGLPIIEVLVNNHVLGMVRQWQKLFYGGRYSQTDLPDVVDYPRLAQAMGLEGMRTTGKKEFREMLMRAIERKKPVLIECDISEDECVWPMVIPGSSLEKTYSCEEYFDETSEDPR